MHSFYELLYFMLHFYTFQCFRFAFFSSCNLRMLQFLPAALCFEQSAAGSIVAIFSILDACGGSGYASTIFMFYFFHVPFFPCSTSSMLHFFMLHLFHVAYFSCCTFSHVALFSCCIHVALFSLSMLHSSHVGPVYYWKILKMNGRQKTRPKSDITFNTVNLFHFYFDILSKELCFVII